MTDSLCEARAAGQGDSAQGASLASGIADKLRDLVGAKDSPGLLQMAIGSVERSGAAQPSLTVSGRLEQARVWLESRAESDSGLGLSALRLLVEEAKRLSEHLSDPQRQRLASLADLIQHQGDQLNLLSSKGQASRFYPFSLHRFAKKPLTA